MKSYLEGIENILGFQLEEKRIMQHEYPDKLLLDLREFLAAKPEKMPAHRASELSCFLSLPDILDDGFNSYVSGGDLEKHWPGDRQIANALLFHERVLIHDHLPHYVSSSLDGYVMEYRYHGLRSWLKKLALWRPLILDDRIQILPKDLSYSTGMKNIWDDGLDQMAMDLLCYFDQYACDMIESGYAEECIMEINEVSYLLDHSLNPDPGKVTDFCSQILHGLFSDVRAELSELVEELRSDKNRKDSDKIEIEKLLFSKKTRWEDQMGKLSLESKTGRKIRMQFTVAFLQQISNQSGETSRITDRVVFETLNTIHGKMCAGDRLGHYSFAIY